MDDYLITQNKKIEDQLDFLIHTIEARLDRLHQTQNNRTNDDGNASETSKANPYSASSILTFKAPYIRDFRNFSPPISADTKQIQQLAGNENIDLLIKNKSWSKTNKQHLRASVEEHYANKHLVKLLKEKNSLLQTPANINGQDVEQKVSLLDEQAEQVRIRKEPRIFVPSDRNDQNIDWCAISAKLSTQHDAHDCRLMWSNHLHWSINNSVWTKDEDVCLINAVAKFGKNDWESVAKELNSNRLAWQCCARYNQEYFTVGTAIEAADRDRIIEVINLCRIGNYVPWNQVMFFIQSYSLHQVKYQWHKHMSDTMGSRPWSHNEDILLMAAVDKFGDKSWARIADMIPGRNNKSCRERYTMRLKYDTRALGRWRRHEDSRLMELVEAYGTNWSLVSAHLPDRNAHQLRNRYELLRNLSGGELKFCPISRKRLLRNSSGELVFGGNKRAKSQEQIEVDEKLARIFSAYRSSKLKRGAKMINRSVQDEMIHQTLVQVLYDTMTDQEPAGRVLNKIVAACLDRMSKTGLLPPSIPTLTGYKTWQLQLDHLSQLSSQTTTESQLDEEPIDEGILKVVVSLFLWPALLSRLKCPALDVSQCQVASIIDRAAKNLYTIRMLQNQLTKS